MQDLIDEREFIDEKPYNPWPFFCICYALVMVHSFTEYIAVRMLISDTGYLPDATLIVLGASHLFIIISLCVVLVFGKSKITLLSRKTLMEGLAGLMGAYSFCSIAYRIFTYLRSDQEHFPTMELVSNAASYFVFFLLMSIILVPIATRRRKKLLRKEAQRPTVSGI